MSYPSDYRYLPFSDTPNYVSKTEYYQIPATSPFEVRLNEVPEKASPSTMTIKIVTGFTDGAPVYGATMTEVSATPASGEYYPDYYTEAAGDNSWNTGTIQFNSANANTTIEVTYMATGGLASIKSNHYPSWMTDRGDGSDGLFAPTADTTITGIKQYTAVFIPSGVTVTITKNAIIKCQGAFVNNGTITADGQGAAGGVGRKRGGESESAYYTNGDDGVGYGGAGSVGKQTQGTVTTQGVGGAINAILAYTNSTHYFALKSFALSCGAGGGGAHDNTSSGMCYGGNGGGAICVIAKSFKNNGTISANGQQGTTQRYNSYIYCVGGGGGGGCVLVVAGVVVIQGTITVSGAAAQTYYSITIPAAANGTVSVKEIGL